jgi:hypothetical protein
MIPCSFVGGYHNFGGTCIINLKDGIMQCHNPEDSILHFQSWESHKFLLSYMVLFLHSYAISKKSQMVIFFLTGCEVVGIYGSRNYG